MRAQNVLAISVIAVAVLKFYDYLYELRHHKVNIQQINTKVVQEPNYIPLDLSDIKYKPIMMKSKYDGETNWW